MRKWLFDEFCVYVCVYMRSHTGSFPRAVLFCSSPRWCRLPWQLHQLWISPSSSSSPSSLCPFLCAPISLFLSLFWFSVFLFSSFLSLSAASINATVSRPPAIIYAAQLVPVQAPPFLAGRCMEIIETLHTSPQCYPANPPWIWGGLPYLQSSFDFFFCYITVQ